jgi:CDP-glucose 4,6-dehydratase
MENLVARPRLPDPAFWRGKRVLLTGHTGFKGAWLAHWLSVLGAHVHGLALAPTTNPNLFEALSLSGIRHQLVDIRDAAAVKRSFQQAEPEIVLHLAAQALVRPAYQMPLETLSTNVMGTAHVLDAMRLTPSVLVGVMVTTDKVYKNLETGQSYPETAELGGYDPYSASKAASELVIAGYRSSFFQEKDIRVASARAGNVIGGGDWSHDRLLPDAAKAWHKEHEVLIRRPDAVRPWQHVLEPLCAYLCLAESLWADARFASAWNFGPDSAATVREVVQTAHAAFGSGGLRFASQPEGPHEAGLLALDAGKAKAELNIYGRWQLAESVQRTMFWYQQFYQGIAAARLCDRDLQDFLEA